MMAETLPKTGSRVVALSGVVDLDTSPEARRRVLDAVRSGGDVSVDLSGVTAIDSSGIASLVEGLEAARRQGTRLILRGVPAPVRRGLSLFRLDGLFPIEAAEPGPER